MPVGRTTYGRGYILYYIIELLLARGEVTNGNSEFTPVRQTPQGAATYTVVGILEHSDCIALMISCGFLLSPCESQQD